MKYFAIAGFKNAGKTTLTERLVAEISGRGLRVSTLKHAHHGFDVDRPGKDSHRHRQAGAQQVLVASDTRWALMTELRGAPEPDLPSLLARLDPVDLVLIEGWKTVSMPKIEVVRQINAHPLLALTDPDVRAVAADGPLAVPCPLFDLNDIAGLAGFILAEVGL